MALATQCPHCRTTFRVAHDQLKLRAGLVRCGACKEIFNGIEHLLPGESLAATQTPTPGEGAVAARKDVPSPAQAAPESAQAKPVPSEAAPAARDSAVAANPLPPAPTASSALDFAYPEPEPGAEAESSPVAESEPDLIADTVVERKPDEPIEVAFVEVPRKSPLPPPEPARPASIHAAPVAEAEEPDPLQRMTLVDFSDEQPEDVKAAHAAHEQAVEAHPEAAPVADDQPDPLDKVMEEFERKPPRSKKKTRPHVRSPIVNMPQEAPAATAPAAVPEPEADEPDFIKRERKKQSRSRGMRLAMGGMSFLLLLAAIGQAGYSFRDQIAARMPESKPLLQSACAYLDCKIELPAQIDSISIESHQIATLATRKDTSELSLLLRNSATIVQRWPQLEMTLIDENNNPLARRVFAPREYLPAPIDERKGFSAGSEQPVKVYFEFTDAKPANYHVDVFYP
jgi:predicted Zn finger-like uncharacterized protein